MFELSLILCVSSQFLFISSYSAANVESKTCPLKVHGTDWILSTKNEAYGWGENTHRAIITLFMAMHEDKITIAPDEQELMITQLNLQLSIALLQNATAKLSQSDLSLYIHALLITGQNPRNFKGVNLVEKLENKIWTEPMEPLSLICLCNLNISHHSYLEKIYFNINNLRKQMNSTAEKEDIALYLTALACFAEVDLAINNVLNPALTIASDLGNMQHYDGSFGNVFTTAIVVHALKVLKSEDWDPVKAEKFLNEQMHILEDNMLLTYIIEMALRKTFFIKDVAPPTAYGYPEKEKIPGKSKTATLTIKSENPSIFHSITLMIHDTPETTMLEFMKLAEIENSNFNFSYYMQNNRPFVYSIGGILNNDEDELYWKLSEITERIYSDRNGHYGVRSYINDVEYPINGFFVKDNAKFVYSYKHIS